MSDFKENIEKKLKEFIEKIISEKITTTSEASNAKQKQKGDYLDLILDYGITYNKLNQNFNPTDGYKIRFSQDLPIYSEDFTLVNSVNFSNYFQTENRTLFSFSF